MGMKCMLAFCSLVIAAACGGTTAPPGAPGGKGGVGGASGARQGSSVDALWAFAPEDAAIGIVVAPGTTVRLYEVVEELVRVVEARPLGKEAMKAARAEMDEIPFDIFDRSAFADAGIDLRLGAALFLDAEENLTMILPVANRQAFRDFVGGAEKTVSGRSFDKMDDELVCTQARSHYVCMQTEERLLAVLNAKASSFAERVYRLPSSYRGDAELVMDVDAFERMDGERDEELHEIIADPGLISAVMQMEPGAMTARFWLQGKLRGDLETVVEASSKAGSLSDMVASMRPSALLRMIMPIKMVAKEVQDETLPGGYSLKRDLLEKMTGEIVAYAPTSKTPWGRIDLGITEAKAFRVLLGMACTMMPPMDFVKIQQTDGRCEFDVDWDQVPGLDKESRAIFNGKMHLSAAVDDAKVSLTIGHESPVLEGSQVSTIGRELLEQEWSYSFWTQNFSLISSLSRPWAKVIDSQPKDMQEGMRYAIWLLSQVSEVAVALSLQSDGIHMMAHIGTYAADSDEAYKAYQAAVMKNIDVGDTVADFDKIRKRWPDSRAAQQSAAANPFSAIFTELMATVSLPAYVKYIEKSKAASAGFTPAK